MNKERYNFPSEHGDDKHIHASALKEGETKAQGETETYPRSLSELVAELEPKPKDTVFSHLLTSRHLGVEDFAITLMQDC